MTCDRCGEEVLKMTFRDDAFGCEFCLPVQGQFSHGGVVVKGENKHMPNMTHADIMHIKSRYIGKDGMVHAAPRWETKEF